VWTTKDLLFILQKADLWLATAEGPPVLRAGGFRMTERTLWTELEHHRALHGGAFSCILQAGWESKVVVAAQSTVGRVWFLETLTGSISGG
jgi:hypothetical protein